MGVITPQFCNGQKKLLSELRSFLLEERIITSNITDSGINSPIAQNKVKKSRGVQCFTTLSVRDGIIKVAVQFSCVDVWL